MHRTALMFSVALGVTAIIVTAIAWFAPLAGETVMGYVWQKPDVMLWMRVLVPVLPVVPMAIFGLLAAARRRKVATASLDATAR